MTTLEEQIKVSSSERAGVSEEVLEQALSEAKEHYKNAVNNFRKQMRAYFDQQRKTQHVDKGRQRSVMLCCGCWVVGDG